jgi:hypothetical protein
VFLQEGLVFGSKVMPQRGNCPAQMRHDCARGDAEHFCGAGGVEVEDKPKRYELPMPGGQPHQRCHDPRVHQAERPSAESGLVRPARVGA